MNFALTEEQKQFRDAAREFAERVIRPAVRHMEETNEFPWDIIRQMGQLGFFGIEVPEEYGGVGADALSYTLVLEEISRVSPAVGVIMSVNTSLAVGGLMQFGTQEQKQKYIPELISGEAIGAYSLTEPQAGSDAASLLTTYRKEGDRYIINGRKIWCTNGPEAKYIILYAVEDVKNPKKTMTAFVIDTSRKGFSVGKVEEKVGLRGAHSAELILEDYEAYPDEILGEEGKGYKIALTLLSSGRIGIASQSLGIGQGAFELALEHATTREQFGKPIVDFEMIQYYISEMATRLDAARLLTYRAAWLKQNGLPYRKESSMAKLYASETANYITDRTIQILASMGYSMEHDGQRYWRDGRVTTIYEGTSEIQRLVIVREILREMGRI